MLPQPVTVLDLTRMQAARTTHLATQLTASCGCQLWRIDLETSYSKLADPCVLDQREVYLIAGSATRLRPSVSVFKEGLTAVIALP